MTENYHFIDGKFITFDLNREEYAVALERVLEIVGSEGILNSNHANPCVRGELNIRKQKVPVLDLRCLFGLTTEAEKEGSSVLITVFGKALSKVGLLVDSMRQVTHIRTGFLEKPPTAEENTRSEYVLGQILVEGRTVVILNLDKWESLASVL